MVKCLNIGKNIDKPIYRSISSYFLHSDIFNNATANEAKLALIEAIHTCML